jgi:hypothetical protein
MRFYSRTPALRPGRIREIATHWRIVLFAGLSLGASALPADPTPTNPPANPPARTGRSLSYLHDETPEKPWSMHVIKVDRFNPDYEFHTTAGGNAASGLSSLLDQIKALPPELGKPIAAINGDFWNKESGGFVGDPTGLQIRQGELMSGPCDNACFWIDAAGRPHATNVVAQFKATWPNGATFPFTLNEERHDGAVLYTPAMGASTHTTGGREIVLEQDEDDLWLPLRAGESYTAKVREVHEAGNTPLTSNIMVLSLSARLAAQTPRLERGALLKLSTATVPDLTGVKTALGGGPVLLRQGKLAPFESTQDRHPRTALGWNTNHIFLVVVDGRQPSLSIGMRLPELAEYMSRIGCDEAINLDGGASATCWIYGQVMNSPSSGKLRPIANGLVVVKKSKPPTK